MHRWLHPESKNQKGHAATAVAENCDSFFSLNVEQKKKK